MIRRNFIIDTVIDLYDELEISAFRFDLKQVCEKMGLNLVPYSSYGDKKAILSKYSEDGFNLINPNNNRIEIYYNDEQYPKERLKFTIPHEIGHISLGHYFLSDDSNINLESEANVFANEFYVPQAFILHYKMFSPSDLVSNFGITYDYALVLLDKIMKRPNKALTKREQKLIEVFERNKKIKSGR